MTYETIKYLKKKKKKKKIRPTDPVFGPQRASQPFFFFWPNVPTRNTVRECSFPYWMGRVNRTLQTTGSSYHFEEVSSSVLLVYDINCLQPDTSNFETVPKIC